MKIRVIENDYEENPLEPYDLILTTITIGEQRISGAWYCCHKCKEEILINGHTIIQNPDGTITITPSLVCPTEGCTGHYHITNSEVVE